MKLLLTGAFSYSETQLERLRSMGHDLIWMQQESDILPAGASEAEGIVCNGLFLHHDPDEFPELKIVQLTSAGLDRVPVDKLRRRGIILRNARGVYARPMAEWALCNVMMHLQRRISLFDSQKKHLWCKQRDVREIAGKKIGIVGAGNIGTEVARLFSAVGAYVIGFDVATEPREPFESIYPSSELAVRVGGCEALIITAPLMSSTIGLVGREVINSMSDGSILVNISRGPLVDEVALIDALRRRRGFVAALDVFETEPLSSESPLWDLENVILTPHNSFVGDGNSGRLFKLIEKAFAN